VVEQHLREIGLLGDDGPDEHQRRLIAAKREEALAAGGTGEGAFPPGAQLCTRCNTQAVVLTDGCMTCLNCGESRCG